MKRGLQGCAITFGLIIAMQTLSWGQGVDDPVEVGTWTSWWDMSEESFNEKLLDLKDKNERPIDLEIYNTEDGEQYSGIWIVNADNRAWACYRNMTPDSYATRWEKYNEQNYRPIDIEINNVDGELKFAGIWEENTENIEWVSWWNMNEETWTEKFNELSGGGFRMKDVEVYPDGDEFKYAAIWVRDPQPVAWRQHNHMTYDDLNEKFQAYREENYRLSDIEAYETGDGIMYAAVWVKSVETRGWAVWWNMDADLHYEKWDGYRNDNYRPTQIIAYQTSDGKRYAALYRDNAPPAE